MKAIFNDSGECQYLAVADGINGIDIPENLANIPSDRLRLVDGEVMVLDVPPVDINIVRSNALGKIDRTAELIRQKFITPGAGQALVYQVKEQEASSFLAANPATRIDDDFPHLLGEVGLTAPSIEEVASTILEVAHQWRMISAAIEKERTRLKHMVRAANTSEEVESILVSANWPSI